MDLTPSTLALIDLALEEDLGRGDVTSDALLTDERVTGVVIAKEQLVLAGGAVFREVFRRVDRTVGVRLLVADGTEVVPGTRVADVKGHARPVLAAERTALNFLQRLSGVATQARRYATACASANVGASGHTRVVDTRKTTPGWRALEKRAVALGGAANHRADLGSGVLIKDNHLIAVGGVAAAVERARAHAPHPLRIEVEVTTLAQLDEALAAGADVVLLDNMSDADVQQSVTRVRAVRPQTLIEVSGGITLERIPRLAQAGVDLISCGALTHSARAVDLSLDLLSEGRG
jgi:nicotinate-nucleotide pyrophosphorylase (carboxylating)